MFRAFWRATDSSSRARRLPGRPHVLRPELISRRWTTSPVESTTLTVWRAATPACRAAAVPKSSGARRDGLLAVSRLRGRESLAADGHDWTADPFAGRLQFRASEEKAGRALARPFASTRYFAGKPRDAGSRTDRGPRERPAGGPACSAEGRRRRSGARRLQFAVARCTSATTTVKPARPRARARRRPRDSRVCLRRAAADRHARRLRRDLPGGPAAVQQSAKICRATRLDPGMGPLRVLGPARLDTVRRLAADFEESPFCH
jgi:hypothetical protein